MLAIIKKVDEKVSKICEVMSFGASIMILLVMFFVAADVFCRVLFRAPVVGLMEIIKMAIPVIAFFMFPWATHELRHVRSTIFYARMHRELRITIDVVAYALGALLFILVLHGSWPEMITAIRIGEFEGEGSLRVATWPTRVLIVVSSILVTWQMIRCAVLAVIAPSEELPTDY